MKHMSRLSLNPITLRFIRQQKHIEQEYQSSAFTDNLRHGRICILVAVLLYSVLIIGDLQIAPDNAMVFYIVRFGVVCPLFLAGWPLSYLPIYERNYDRIGAFYVVLTSTGFTVMGLFAPIEYHFVYFVGVLVCLIFGYTFVRLPFTYALSSGLISGAVYAVGQIFFSELNINLLTFYIVFLFTVQALLMVICYTDEKRNRYSFYLLYLLTKERDKTRSINNELAESLDKVKQLSGLLPICASCNKIRDDQGYWNRIESYIGTHSEAEFSHGICPDCAKKLYPDIYDEALIIAEQIERTSKSKS